MSSVASERLLRNIMRAGTLNDDLHQAVVAHPLCVQSITLQTLFVIRLAVAAKALASSSTEELRCVEGKFMDGLERSASSLSPGATDVGRIGVGCTGALSPLLPLPSVSPLDVSITLIGSGEVGTAILDAILHAGQRPRRVPGTSRSPRQHGAAAESAMDGSAPARDAFSVHSSRITVIARDTSKLAVYDRAGVRLLTLAHARQQHESELVAASGLSARIVSPHVNKVESSAAHYSYFPDHTPPLLPTAEQCGASRCAAAFRASGPDAVEDGAKRAAVAPLGGQAPPSSSSLCLSALGATDVLIIACPPEQLSDTIHVLRQLYYRKHDHNLPKGSSLTVSDRSGPSRDTGVAAHTRPRFLKEGALVLSTCAGIPRSKIARDLHHHCVVCTDPAVEVARAHGERRRAEDVELEAAGREAWSAATSFLSVELSDQAKRLRAVAEAAGGQLPSSSKVSPASLMDTDVTTEPEVLMKMKKKIPEFPMGCPSAIPAHALQSARQYEASRAAFEDPVLALPQNDDVFFSEVWMALAQLCIAMGQGKCEKRADRAPQALPSSQARSGCMASQSVTEKHEHKEAGVVGQHLDMRMQLQLRLVAWMAMGFLHSDPRAYRAWCRRVAENGDGVSPHRADLHRTAMEVAALHRVSQHLVQTGDIMIPDAQERHPPSEPKQRSPSPLSEVQLPEWPPKCAGAEAAEDEPEMTHLPAILAFAKEVEIDRANLLRSARRQFVSILRSMGPCVAAERESMKGR